MEIIQLPNSGAAVTSSDRGLHVVIPVRKEWSMVILCVLSFLMFGTATLAMLFAIPDVLNDPSKPLWLFIPFLILLIATDILMIGLVLWNLTGRRIIHVNSIRMILQYKMLGFAREQKFDLEKIDNLQVRNLKEFALPGSDADRMDDKTFIASLDNYSITSMVSETFFDRLMKIDLTKLHKLRFNDLRTSKDPLEPYRFSRGFCSGILFDYNTKRHEFGMGIINGAESEQLVNIITQRYRILGSKKG
ncbi:MULTISPECIES: hypothetical protein [Cyanophyceae]|uniref:Bacterial Pleckstrin homology domain-containing protein n=1 Tax=Leptolyngbya subtilissima DQ-A4 TaxID=2933933 RepID=A0ABV0KBZ7_9CYAN|nr:hypothetical protein [Nodosilinea sp. FACHB-141]MBD2110773.1 hypothetical protein [Nodosilinea sp. FACHB-141]